MTGSLHSNPQPPPDDHWQTRVQHVWVASPSITYERSVGILLAWRKRRGAWEGWVIYAEPGIPARGGGPVVTQGWLEAGRIEAV